MISLSQSTDPFVVFVGAGASAMPPSSLPAWTHFNNLLMKSLCERLDAYSRNRQPTADMLALFRQRRDETGFFAPDFQAQLVEEEVGPEYFRVWQSLETNVFGPVHAGLAELASTGRLAAIITTNFDRLIETALEERGQAFDVFYDRAGFEALATRAEVEHTPALPVIKIHGSIEDATSLIDTLKQRLVGRPESLQRIIRQLLERHPWLFLGFSGADFDYDPHYLGILDAAGDAKGFIFLARSEPVRDGVVRLQEAYGPEKASIVYGDLTTFLSDTFGLTTPTSTAGDSNGADAEQRVMDGIRRWTEALGPMAVVNILCSMLRSSGREADAMWLLRRTWKSYRATGDTTGRSYDRYNYNYGFSLLEGGFIRNPVALAEDMSNLSEWKEHADQNAFEYLARSYKHGNLLAAGGQLARLLALRGEVAAAIELAATVNDDALAQDDPLALCDIAIASATVYDIVQSFTPAVRHFQQCLQIARDLGDEPRRALLAAHLGRFLTYAGKFEEADSFIEEASRISRRLDLRWAMLESDAARGLWLADSAASPDRALEILQGVAEAIRVLNDVPLVTKIDLAQPDTRTTIVKGRHPLLCRVLLDLNRAALFVGDGTTLNQTLDELDELTVEYFLGYCPHYYLTFAQCLVVHRDEDGTSLLNELIDRARRLGEDAGNAWVAAAADQIAREAFLT